MGMRRWAIAFGVALFVLVDAFLVYVAVKHGQRASADPGLAVPRQSVSTSSIATTPSTTASSPPIVTSTARSVPSSASAPPTTSSPAGQQAAGSAGPVLLDMSSDGLVVRAAVGDCHGAGDTAVEVSKDNGLTWTKAGDGLRMVLRVSARTKGDVWYIGAGSDCALTGRESLNSGETWGPGVTDGTWYLSPDPTAQTVQGANGTSEVGCTPRALAAVSTDLGYVLCQDGAVRASSDRGATWATRSSLSGAVAVSFTGEKDGYALAPSGDCPAAIWSTSDGAATWAKLACLAGRQPQAVAAAGDRVLAQVDGSLQVSTDKGTSWKPVG